jgi:hypothetical protein
VEHLDESAALRAKVEDALRFFVKLPLRPGSQGAFLEIPGPGGKRMAFSESEGRVDLAFGPGRGSFDFSGSWLEEEGEGEDAAPLHPETAEAELEEDFKEELEAMVNMALDILDESAFAARYPDQGVPMEGIFPAEEFAAMKSLPGFSSVSWKGKFDFGAEA